MQPSRNNPHVANVHVPAHLLGLIALVYVTINFSWTSVASFLLFNLWISGLGMSVGFHRYFSHRSFTTTVFWRRVMLVGGTLACQGSAVFWVALHRKHHRHSDDVTDAHSPAHLGFWNAYMGWILRFDPSQINLSQAVDVIRDPWARVLHKQYNRVVWAYWSSLGLIAVLAPETRSLVAGAFLAGAWAIHQEALLNSFCHSPRFGTAPNVTGDRSRNVWWLNYLTWGQSFHNTHHAFPANPSFGADDIGYKVVRLIEKA